MLCFDGDAAGQKAAIRAALRALPLLRPGRSLRFVTLPAGRTPTILSAPGGRSAMEALLASPSRWSTGCGGTSATPPARHARGQGRAKARLIEHVERSAPRHARALPRRMLLERFSALHASPARQRVAVPAAAMEASERPIRPPQRARTLAPGACVGTGGHRPPDRRRACSPACSAIPTRSRAMEALEPRRIADRDCRTLAISLLDAAMSGRLLDQDSLNTISAPRKRQP